MYKDLLQNSREEQNKFAKYYSTERLDVHMLTAT